jgi:hypothetical protein
MIQDPTTASPVEIDTELSELDKALPHLSARVAIAVNKAHVVAGDRKDYRTSRNGIWRMSDREAMDALEARTDDGAVQTLTVLNKAISAVDANRAEFYRLDAEYRRRGTWTRFVQVEHIHSGWHCAGGTLDRGIYRSERYWRPELSGTNEADAIALLQAEAHTLCTHCFPNAPVVAKPVDTDVCPGSGKHVNRAAGRHNTRYATCPGCGEIQSLTSGLNYRTHDTPTATARKLAEKAAAQGKLVVAGELKTVRATELAASDPYADEEDRNAAIAALATHRGESVETVQGRADTKRRQRQAKAGW